MSREIKFRAWDKETKSMIKEVWEIGLKSNYNQPWLIGDDKRTDNFELMQYTGLKDKNGKEIYEGDILKHIPTFEANYFVKNLTGGFYLCPNNKDYGEYFASLFAGYDHKNQCNSIEIIGNIYENPELLNKDGE